MDGVTDPQRSKCDKNTYRYIPFYADLKKLFQTILGKDYTIEDYVRQFSTRVTEQLQKVYRIIDIYSTKVPDTPPILLRY